MSIKLDKNESDQFDIAKQIDQKIEDQATKAAESASVWTNVQGMLFTSNLNFFAEKGARGKNDGDLEKAAMNLVEGQVRIIDAGVRKALSQAVFESEGISISPEKFPAEAVSKALTRMGDLVAEVIGQSAVIVDKAITRASRR